MARSATTTDPFNAVAELRRRQILELLTQGELSVNDIAESLGLKQPQASKHLNVLKQVGLVSVRGQAQQRLYKLNAAALKPIHEWVKPFEQLWNERLDRLDAYLREIQADQVKQAKQAKETSDE